MSARTRIDILIDLSNHTIGNRMLTFAMKPAPVQITLPRLLRLAQASAPSTTASTDPHIDHSPPTQSVRQGKTPPSAKTPSRSRQKPSGATPRTKMLCEITHLPATSRNTISLGSFNYFSKCNDQALALWARLLNEIPNTRFMLHVPTGNRQTYVRQFFASRGISSDRLETGVPRTGEKTYFSRYNSKSTSPWTPSPGPAAPPPAMPSGWACQ